MTMTQQKLTGTRRQLANLLGLSERRITDLVTAKILPPRGPAGFDLTASVQGYIAFLKSDPGNLKSERLRYQKLKSDIFQMQMDERLGKLVLRDAVAKKLYELKRRNRDAISNIPSRLSGIIAA
jgi:hypothetical protein